MKRTQKKDALRNIWKQKVSWFAIVVIAMLSVMAYLGINFASRGIARNGNTFYKETHFRDVEIISTFLITPDDLDAILAVEGVADAEGVNQTSGKIENAGLRENVDVVTLTERINIPMLLEGRLPATEWECAVEQPVMESLGLSLGDSINIAEANSDRALFLARNDFVITGVVCHPDHAAWPDQIPGNRDVLVLPEAFDREVLDGCYMKALLLVDGTAGMDRFGAEYKAVVSEVMGQLETLSAARTAIRDEAIQAQYQDEINSSRAELDDGLAELNEARAEMDDGWNTLAEETHNLTDGEKQLSEGRQQLKDAWQELLDGNDRLEAAEAELASAKEELESGAAELRSAQMRLSAAEQELLDSWNALEDAKEAIRGAIRSAVEGIFGSDTSGLIAWAPRAAFSTASTATAMDFWITNDFKCDMSKSLDANIAAFIYSDVISDEMLTKAYGAMMGGAE